MAYETELQFAIQAVSQAARLAIAVQREIASDDALAKEDRSPVTVADFGVQALISHALQQAYPNDPFMGEENSAALSSPEAEGIAGKIIQRVVKIKSEIERDEVLPLIDRASHDGGSTGRFWTLDPIDGTKGFLRRQQYAIALALIENGEVVAGVLGCPNLSSGGDPENGSHGSIFAACKGQGAQTLTIDGDHPTTICTRDISETDAAIVCESVEAAHSDHSTSAEVARILGITADPVRIDSQCKYAVVARGDADIYL
ncbi:MAG: 3'(2'),5'-bisphosphate nucleotidase, partial [Planctomycetes bacterium]|nr:3'(2'),5'-bisphosphate nucleotidase [Planctomycetota bacterium]